MNKTKIAKLKAAGFAVGNAQDFLELTPEESAYVELRLSLAKYRANRPGGGKPRHAAYSTTCMGIFSTKMMGQVGDCAAIL